MKSNSNKKLDDYKRIRNYTAERKRKVERPMSSVNNGFKIYGEKDNASMVTEVNLQSYYNLYDKESYKEGKEKQKKLEQMRNRITYIEREGQKNLSKINLKKQKIKQLKETKNIIKNWREEVKEAKKKQESEKMKLKRKVSNISTHAKNSIVSIKQKLFENKQKNYMKMKEEKEKLKKEREENKRREMELKKVKAKRKQSTRKSTLFSINKPGSQVNIYQNVQRTSKANNDIFAYDQNVTYFNNSASKKKLNVDYEKEIQRLQEIEKEKLNALESILKENKEMDVNYEELTQSKVCKPKK